MNIYATSMQLDSRRVLAVDVCGTLFPVNTTAGLVKHHHRRAGNRWRSHFLWLITQRRLPFLYLLLLASKVTGFDFHRWLVLASLRNVERDALERSAQSYARALQAQQIPAVHRLLAAMRAEGWQPVLVSNSLATIVAPVAGGLGVPYVASQLEWREGRCTGRLSVDLTGSKRRHLEGLLGRSLSESPFAVITDNRSDADLIEAAAPAHLVARGEGKAWMKAYDAQLVRY